MKTIAKLKQEDRKFIFLKTSESLGKNVSIVEKDYWICYLLDFIFTKSSFKEMLVFKGGTSLSKGYNLINRMSEDIDLILDWGALGDSFNLESWENDKTLSKSKLDKNKKKILKRTDENLINEFAPNLSREIKDDLGYELKISCVEKIAELLFI